MLPLPLTTCTGHNHFALCVEYSADGKIIASGGADNCVRLWDTETGEQRNNLLGHSDYVYSIKFSPTNQQLLASAGCDALVILWNLSIPGQIMFRLVGHGAAVRSLSFSPDGQKIASGSGAQTSSEAQDDSMRIWDVSTGRQAQILHIHSKCVTCVSWSPTRPLLASASKDRIVGIFDLSSSSFQPLKGHADFVLTVSWSLDGNKLASAGSDRTIRLWDIEAKKEMQVLRTIHTSTIWSICWDAKGSIISGSADRTVAVYDTQDEGRVVSTHAHAADIYAVACAVDGSTFAAAGKDGKIVVWDRLGRAFRLALAMGLQRRLGQKSVIHTLSRDLLVHIVTLI